MSKLSGLTLTVSGPAIAGVETGDVGAAAGAAAAAGAPGAAGAAAGAVAGAGGDAGAVGVLAVCALPVAAHARSAQMTRAGNLIATWLLMAWVMDGGRFGLGRRTRPPCCPR